MNVNELFKELCAQLEVLSDNNNVLEYMQLRFDTIQGEMEIITQELCVSENGLPLFEDGELKLMVKRKKLSFEEEALTRKKE